MSFSSFESMPHVKRNIPGLSKRRHGDRERERKDDISLPSAARGEEEEVKSMSVCGATEPHHHRGQVVDPARTSCSSSPGVHTALKSKLV